MRKIDIHCHTTRSLLQNIVPKSATLTAIAEEMQRYNIASTVLLASYFPNEGKGISNYRLLHWVKDYSQFKMFGSLDFQYYFKAGFAELNELAEANLVSGIKIYAGYQQIDFTAKKFQQVAMLAAKYHLPLMFHCGFLQGYENDATRALSPKILASVAQQFPDVSLIVSHLAFPFVSELITLIKQHANVYTDTSGLLDSYKNPESLPDCVAALKYFLNECGASRLLFGTDFPVQTHAHSVALIETAMENFPLTEKENVYYNNATKLLSRSAALSTAIF